MSKKKVKSEKKYAVIVKVGATDFKKWRTNNLLKFALFLDTKHPTWRYFNVFCRKTRLQVGAFTKNNRPTQKYI